MTASTLGGGRGGPWREQVHNSEIKEQLDPEPLSCLGRQRAGNCQSHDDRKVRLQAGPNSKPGTEASAGHTCTSVMLSRHTPSEAVRSVQGFTGPGHGLIENPRRSCRCLSNYYSVSAV